MASKALSTGLRVVASKQRALFSGALPTSSWRVSVAHITGRSSRVEPEEKPKPWPYMEWGYNNWMAYWDGTLKRMGENSKVIVVEGPPAIGKSALARALAEELEMKYFPMVNGDSIYINQVGFDERTLDSKLPPRIRSYDELAFAKCPDKDKTIRLQMLLWTTKFQQYIDALAHVLNTGQGVVLDRCVYSADVFTDTLLEMGFVNKIDREVLMDMQERGIHELMRPHLIVYLDAPPAVVEANLKKRGRGEEKVWNRQLLERLDYNYKHKYLKEITQHAELVAYDWSTPGDAEVIVEDIERIDFDRFDIHDPKMEDWRLKESWDWNEQRWLYTHKPPMLLGHVLITGTQYKAPSLTVNPEEQFIIERVLEEEKVPGVKYQYGYNPEDGKKNTLWFTRPFANITWVDHELQKTNTI